MLYTFDFSQCPTEPSPQRGLRVVEASAPWVSELLPQLRATAGDPAPRLVGIESACGTGKSQGTAQYLEGRRGVWLTHLSSLETAGAVRTDGASLAQIRRGEWDDERDELERERAQGNGEYWRRRDKCAELPRLSLTVASLARHYLAGRKLEADVLVIDEPVQLLDQLLRGDIFRRDRREALATLLSAVRRAQQVVVLDAGLEPELLEALARAARIPLEQCLYLKNTHVPSRGSDTAHFHDHAASLAGVCARARRAGKRVLWQCSSRTEAERVARKYPGALLVTAETRRADQRVRHLIANPRAFAGQYPLVVSTPVISSGVSFDALEDGKPAFDVVIVQDSRSGPQGTSVDDACQKTARVRHAPGSSVELHVYVGELDLEVPSVEELRQRFLKRWEAQSESVVSLAGLLARELPDYEAVVDLAAAIEHRHLLRLTRAEECVLERLRADGWQIGERISASATEKELRCEQLRAWQDRQVQGVLRASAPNPRWGAGYSAEEVAEWGRHATAVREAAKLPEGYAILPQDELLVKLHLRHEREGGLEACLAELASRVVSARARAERIDLTEQGYQRDAEGRVSRRLTVDFSGPEPARKWAEPVAPPDASAEIRALALREAALAAGEIDPALALANGLLVRRDQVLRAAAWLESHASECDHYEVVSKVSTDKAGRGRNVGTLLRWYGLRVTPCSGGSWWVGLDPALRAALERRNATPAPKVDPRESRLGNELQRLAQVLGPVPVSARAGIEIGWSARHLLVQLETLGLSELRTLSAGATPAARAAALGRVLVDRGWVRRTHCGSPHYRPPGGPQTPDPEPQQEPVPEPQELEVQPEPTTAPAPNWSERLSSGCLSLAELLGAQLPKVSRADLEQVYADPQPLPLDPNLLGELLESWERKGSEDETERAAALGLRKLVEQRATSVSYACTSREAHGGRRMFWVVPDHSGPVVLSRKGEAKIRASRFLLQAVPAELRKAFPAPQGCVWLDLDLRSAHPAAAAALSGDAQLAEDVRGDAHQRAGDAIVPHEPDASRRRAVGKVANSLLLCGGTWSSLHRACAEAGVPLEEHEAHAAWHAWWARYPALAALRDAWWSWTQTTRDGLEVVRPDGSRYKLAPSELNGGAPAFETFGSWGDRHAAAFRSSFSSLWRAIESSILDRALTLLAPLRSEGLRLVLPLYDGALFAVSEGKAEELARKAREAFEQAAREAGVEARADLSCRRVW